MNIEKNLALQHLVEQHIKTLSDEEGISIDIIKRGLEQGTMVLLANPNHNLVHPTLIGQPARIKINANLGTSPLNSCLDEELQKLRVAEEAGTDAVMDLSTHGDLDAIRRTMLAKTHCVLGTVPIYA
ncbi:MAG: phosphomethylpyrimidine synthase ThiC, partial [Desulfovibrio sp.]|nr:phosphomethylpyrimidine synthase ThiC [Desulfovibrio sp.]